MRATFLPLLLLVACGGDDTYTQAGGLNAQDYLPPAEAWLQFGPVEQPDVGPFLMVDVGASSWELRQGDSWTEATDTEQLPVASDDGVSLGGALVLPAKLSEGQEQDGVTVTSIGEEETYYGTFSLAVRSAVPSGRFAGEWVFAPAQGPVIMVIDGQEWELVYYE
jgi:hypothetical protein